MLRTLVWLAVVFAPCACDAPKASASSSPLLADATPSEVFAVLDRFDPRDFTTFPFVRVATAWGRSWDDAPATNDYHHGFLLADDGRHFVVQDLDGTRREFTHTPPHTPEWRRVGHSQSDLRRHAAEVAEVLRSSSGRASSRVDPYKPVSNTTYALLTARACSRLALHDAVTSMHAAWVRLPWLEALPNDLATMASLALEDPTLAWPDHLARRETLCAVWPHDGSARFWARDCDAIRDWIDAGIEPLDESEVRDASDAELLDGLVDVCLPSHSNWDTMPFDWASSRSEVFTRPRSPIVGELVRRGPAVVPLLVAHRDDQRPSRSWNWFSRKSGCIYGTNLGANVQRVLAEIVGDDARAKDFDAAHWCATDGRPDRRTHRLAQMTSGQPAWNTVHHLLLEQPDAFAEVLALVCPDGDAVFDARVLCLHAIANHHSQQAVDLVVARLRAGLSAADEARRTSAAWCLFELGDPSGAAVVVDAWNRGAVDPETPWEDLLHAGGVVLWDGIERHLAEPAFAQRLLPALVRMPPEFVLANAHGLLRRRITGFLRSHLLARLADETVAGAQWPIPSGEGEVVVHTATFADLAATLLAAWFPRDFTFDPGVCGSRRLAQIRRLRGQRPPELSTPAPETSAPQVTTLHVGAVVFLGGPETWPTSVRDASLQFVDRDIDPRLARRVLVDACTSDPDHAHLVTFERDAGGTSFVAQLGRRAIRRLIADTPQFYTRYWVTVSGTIRQQGSLDPFLVDGRDTSRLVNLSRPIDDSVEFTLEVERAGPRRPAPR
ncbi:MAG: hypothetical protein JNK15_19630 [Planctomycetes bacterium]|nr:hypothetical protein [Planctomycetota bacterium]